MATLPLFFGLKVFPLPMGDPSTMRDFGTSSHFTGSDLLPLKVRLSDDSVFRGAGAVRENWVLPDSSEADAEQAGKSTDDEQAMSDEAEMQSIDRIGPIFLWQLSSP